MSQIFKKPIPNNILFDLLKNISTINDTHYLLSKTSFKLAVYHNYLNDFCNAIKEYYHSSKLYYVERKLNYTKFITIVRQICSYNKISYTSNIVYNNSSYDIIYYINKV